MPIEHLGLEPPRAPRRRHAPVLLLAALIALVRVTASIAGEIEPAVPAPLGALAAEGDPVIRAAGDIACDPASSKFNGGNGTSRACRQRYTAELLPGADAILPLGDEQYEEGTLEQFNRSYDLSWGAGAYLSVTRPVPGNHEYLTGGAAGYFAYYGESIADPLHNDAGYYSGDIGAWHMIAINSSVALGTASAQHRWVADDLAANASQCALAYWHEPYVKAGKDLVKKFRPIWQLLYDGGVDVVLNGHVHNYQRLKRLGRDAQVEPSGMQEFIVGTGGKSHGRLLEDPKLEVGNAKSYGVLELTLRANGYDWRFVPEAAGSFSDSGSATCR